MSILLYLLPLGLIFDLVGYLPPTLRLFLLYGLLALPLCLNPSKKAGWLAAGLGFGMILRAAISLPEVAETALFLLLHLAIWTAMAPVPRPLRMGVVAYAVIHLGLFVSPLGHPVQEALAGFGNQLSQSIAGQPFHLGPTYQNLAGLLLFLTLSVFSWDGTKVAALRTAGFLLIAVLLNALGAAVLIEKADFAASFAWSLKFRDAFGFPELWKQLKGLAVIVFPAFLFLSQLAAYVALHYSRAAKPGGEPAVFSGWPELRSEFSRGKQPLLMAGIAALAVLVLTPPTAWRRPGACDVVFLDRGVVSFTKPDYTRYGESAGGMFGMLPEYVRLFGSKAVVVKEIPPQLDPNQVLVLTNLDEDLGPETRQRVWDFVSKGGRLWVMGDHTFIKNGRNHLNEILEPYGILFNNDSAQFFPQGWFNSYRIPQGTPFSALSDDDENRLGVLVGASLALRVPATPFLTGSFAYADLGLDEPVGDSGYLGDFKYQPRERLGDLVLIAGQTSGRGKVLVFGDTSSFFNNNMPRSFELLRACLGWLGESNGWDMTATWWGRGVALLLVVAFVFLAFRSRMSAGAGGVLAAVGLVSLLTHGTGGQPDFAPAVGREHLAVIDFSHQPNASKHSAMDNGLHGVAINLMRHGELPVTMNRWDPALLDVARYVFLDAPRRPIGRGERADLMEFMRKGGTVVLGCGYLDAGGCGNLLDPLGCAIGDVPLGRFFDLPAFGQPVSFMSAWGIKKVPPGAKIICASPDWPLMVSVPVGKGALVLISDTEFLHNRNLEGHKNHDPANTAFVKNLLDSTAR